MPQLSSQDLTRLRTTRHHTQLYLFVYKPQTIWTARVNGAQNQGDTSIAVNNVVQIKSPPTHAHIKVGSAAGRDDYGTLRYKSYGSPTLHVGAHNALLPNGAYLTLVEEIKPATIIPRINASGTVYEDRTLPYADQTENYHPLARFGCPAVAWLENGNATVNFYSDAVALAAGATITNYAWSFPSGTPSSSNQSGSVATPVQVTWTHEGQYYVSLTVTDSNGKTHTTYKPVFVAHRDNASSFYDKVEVTKLEGDIERGGWSAAFKVRDSATESDFPDNALVVLAADDWYGDERVSIGGDWTYRENIVFVGYVRGDTIAKKFGDGAVQFEADGIGVILDNLLAWGANLKRKRTPTKWHELKNMNPDKVAFHILTEHSTLDHICDLDLSAPSYSLKYIDTTESTLRDQLSEQLYTCVRARIASSRTGRLYARANPQLLEPADRPTTSILQTDDDDLRDEVDLGTEHHEKQVAQVDFIGFKYGEDSEGNMTIDPVFSLAPKRQWATGQVERVDGIRVRDQEEANVFAGLFEGWRNNDFSDISIAWRGNYRVFDIIPHERINLNLRADQNNRGLDFNATDCWTKRVTLKVQGGALLVDTVVEKGSYGNAGKSGSYPTVPPSPPPPTPPPATPPSDIPPIPPVPPDVPPDDDLGTPTGHYDFLDGYGQATSGTMTMLMGVTTTRFQIYKVGLSCAGSAVTLTLKIDDVTRLTAVKSGSTWTISVYDQNAALLSTESMSGNKGLHTLSQVVVISGGGMDFKTTLNADAACGYSFAGFTY